MVAAGGLVPFAVNNLASNVPLQPANTTAVSLLSGIYLITVATTLTPGISAEAFTALVLNGVVIPATQASAANGTNSESISMQAIVSLAAPGTVSVINSSAFASTFSNTTMTILKLA